jgi:hypothetical protein
VAALEVERAELASKNAMLQKLASIRGDGAAAAAETVSFPNKFERRARATQPSMVLHNAHHLLCPCQGIGLAVMRAGVLCGVLLRSAPADYDSCHTLVPPGGLFW